MRKDILGYENIYTIDEDGIIIKVSTGQIMKPVKVPNGYWVVGLRKDGIKTMHYIHRLLAISFIPNPENKRTVDHIDYDRGNYKLSNLRWFTYSEQKKHSACRMKGMDNKNHSLVLHTEYGVFFNVKEAAFICGKAPQNMSHVLNPMHKYKNKTKFIYV